MVATAGGLFNDGRGGVDTGFVERSGRPYDNPFVLSLSKQEPFDWFRTD